MSWAVGPEPMTADRIFIGVDLGQSRDYTAVAMVERAELRGVWDAAVYAHRKQATLRLRHLERLALGTPYPEMVERVVEMAESPAVVGRCQLVVDGTGVGRPVVDLLRRARPGCGMVPVTVTAGERETHEAGYWRVPKRDLMSRLQLMFQGGELALAKKLEWGPALVGEMRAMEVKIAPSGREQFGAWREGTHDDLVFAVALACWGARKMFPGDGSGWWKWNQGSDLGRRLLGM